ncbi:MAG: sensor histidine kinase [Magnetospiraceae bacterium]
MRDDAPAIDPDALQSPASANVYSSVATRVAFGLFTVAILVLIISGLSYNRMERFRVELSDLSATEFPRIARAAQLTSDLQSISTLAKQLAETEIHAARRIAWADIETHLARMRALMAGLSPVEGIGSFGTLTHSLAATLQDLNVSATRHIDQELARQAAIRQLQGLTREVDHLARQAKEIDAKTATWERDATQIITESVFSASLDRHRVDRRAERRAELALQTLIPPPIIEAEAKALQAEIGRTLFGESGYFGAVRNALVYQGRANGLATQANLLAAEAMTRAQSIFERVRNNAWLRASDLNKTVESYKFYLLVAGGILLLKVVGVYLYFLASLTQRLVRLNDSIRSRLSGGNAPIVQRGDDEIARISQSVAYFMDEIDQRQQKLVVGERQFRDLVEGSVLAIAILRENQIIFHNSAFRHLFERNGVPGLPTLDRLPGDALAAPDDVSLGQINRVRLPLEGVQDLWVDYVVSPVIWQGAAATQLSMIDVTPDVLAEAALTEAKEKAELANRSKNEFLASMSHELRTPLNAIIGFSEALLAGLFGGKPEPRNLDAVQDIHDAGRHLQVLVDDLLDLSRIETDALELQEEPVRAWNLTDACIRLVRGRAEKAGVTIKNEFKDYETRLFVDSRRIKQVLVNLLTNAVKFTEVSGVVTLAGGKRADGQYELRVSDTGIGIAEEDITRILDPFVQVGDILTRKTEGAGIGLPLSKSLMELHGGALSVESSLGNGTTVTLVFPKDRILVLTPPEQRDAPAPRSSMI